MKKKITVNVIFLIISLVYGFLALGMVILLKEKFFSNQKLGKNEFEATVVEVFEKDNYYTIKTEGNAYLLLLNKDTIINVDILTNLTEGDKVFFKLTELYEMFSLTFGELEVATIRTETKDVISEESFYRNDEKNTEAMSNMALIILSVFTGIAFYNIWAIRKKRKEFQGQSLKVETAQIVKINNAQIVEIKEKVQADTVEQNEN